MTKLQKGQTRLLIVAASLPVLFLYADVAHADSIQSACPYTWSTSMQMGTVSTDVLHLQQFLNTDSETRIAVSGAGSPGHESKKFGSMTKQAVIHFQNKYTAEVLTPAGLHAGTGVVGSLTRAKLNALCGAVTVTPTTATSTVASTTILGSQADSLTTSVPVQPTATLAPAGALHVPFTNFSLTAGSKDVTVSSVTVKQVGQANDNVFDYLSLLDSTQTELSYAYFRSDHTVTFKDPFTVSAGTTQTFTIAGDMASDLSNNDGQMPMLAVTAITASSPLAGTSLPIRGIMNTANTTLAIGTATVALSSYDPMSDSIHYINDTNVRFSGVRITAGSEEDVRLDSITWEQDGTAGSDDIANVNVVINDVSYPATADGRYYTATIPGGLVIKKGYAIDAYIEGNPLVSAANRTIEFDIHYNTDIAVTGMMYGYGLSVYPSGNTDITGHSVFLTSDGTTDGDSLTPFFAGSVASIQGGTFVSLGR